MADPSALTPAQREQAIALFEQGYGQKATARQVNGPYQSVRSLHARWRVHGRMALVTSSTKRFYPFELKLEAVTRAQAGEATTDLAVELGVSTPRLIQRWSELYRIHGVEGLESKPRGRPAGKPAAELS